MNLVSEVYHGDNLEFMAKFPDGFFDLAVPDIEYCIGASAPTKKDARVTQKNGYVLNIKLPTYKKKNWDFKKSSDEYFKELFRVSKNQIIWGGNYYGLSGGMIVWDKLNGESDQMGCEIAWNSMNNRTDIVYYMWAGMMQGVYCGKNVRKALVQQGNKQLNEKRIHETQKPIALYQWLYSEYARPGFKILDTHMGSQSSRIAAYKMGFDYWGCELDNDHFINGCKRFEEETYEPLLKEINKIKQQTIF